MYGFVVQVIVIKNYNKTYRMQLKYISRQHSISTRLSPVCNLRNFMIKLCHFAETCKKNPAKCQFSAAGKCFYCVIFAASDLISVAFCII